MPWTARAKIEYSHGTSEEKTIDGVLRGTSVTDVYARYDDLRG